MAKLIVDRDVWPEIRRSARLAKLRHVAVAFLGEASPKLLPLRAGDILVANLSESSIRSGSTRVRPARTFYRSRVHLCNEPDLHAKLFVFDDTVIIGSPNASALSEGRLIEAIVKISDRRLATSARRFVQSLAHTPVTPAYLRLCTQWYKESAPARSELLRPKARPGQRTDKPRVWILATEPLEFTTASADDRRAQRQIKHPREYVREALAWRRAPELGPQDQVIVAHDTGRRLQVLPPGRVLGTGTSIEGDNVVYIEQPRRPLNASPKAFRKLVARALGLRRKSVPTRRIPSAWIGDFLRLWPHGYSADRVRRAAG